MAGKALDEPFHLPGLPQGENPCSEFTAIIPVGNHRGRTAHPFQEMPGIPCLEIDAYIIDDEYVSAGTAELLEETIQLLPVLHGNRGCLPLGLRHKPRPR